MEQEARFGFFFIFIFSIFIITTPSSANPSWQPRSNWSSEGGQSQSGKSAYSGSTSRTNRNLISPFSPGSNNIALDLGQVFLFGNLGNHYADNIGFQLHYTYGVSELFAFDSSLGYSEHSDGKFSMTTFLTGLRTNLSWYDKVVPFFSFGLGFYRPSYRLSTEKENESAAGSGEDKIENVSTLAPVLFGVHLGPGIDLEISSQIFFGAALTFHDVFGTTKYNQGKKPIEVGGTFTTFLIHAGYTF